jgi:tRNA pseudouridine55 synthase
VSKRSSTDGPDGLAVVDKPAGWTSHDVVARARRLLGTRKVGHSGTLDPDATGVLLLGVGRATRLLRFTNHLPKTYTGTFVLGVETDTLDAAGEVTATHDMSAVTEDDVLAALPAFVGDIEQIPPMVSAVKVDGKRLHQLAREGKEIERKPRPVTVHRFEVAPVAGEPLTYAFEVECSSGTYVRTLAADLGRVLGGGAHLATLRRTAIGPFRSDVEAVPLEDLTPDVLLPLTAAAPGLPAVEVREETAVDVGHGKVLPIGVFFPDGDPEPPVEWAVVDSAGTLLAIYARHRSDTAKPSIVLVTAPPQGGTRPDGQPDDDVSDGQQDDRAHGERSETDG